MAKRRSKKHDELSGQPDPRAPLDSAALLAAAAPVLARLEQDLLERVKASPSVAAALEARHAKEKEAHRTAESLAGWTAALATQVAAAWLLSCVFVRTLEDRGLLRQHRIAGPGAEDSQRAFFQLAPSLTERDYLLTIFKELAHHPAAKALFDTEHSLVWKLSPSADAVKELLALFRAPTAATPAFRFGQPSTRFLGDLYQDLSEDVRKRYALLQTPDFIESFILDRTLGPAIARFGLDDTTLIDPTCGSGHFLLGAFDRLFDHRLRAEPGLDVRQAALKALDAVHGADINPYAVAIARFRLVLAFLDKAGYTKLADAPALPLHLVVADSLRINPQHPQPELWHQEGVDSSQWLGRVFTLEDEQAARDVLFKQYAAVVGNPPYITVKDSALREVYRGMYTAAAGKYALSAPFCERFFQLARSRGYTGQITANSFMKREFGKRLLEEVLPTVNLELIVNTSGAYIPGHGTPTVLLFGTHEPRQDTDVLAVLAKRGEPSTPDVPSDGLVWRSIAEHYSEVGFENDYISVARVESVALEDHPWSLGGGGASELKQLLEERAATTLGEVVDSIGVAGMSNADDVFNDDLSSFSRYGIGHAWTRRLVIGEDLRDWSHVSGSGSFFPYNSQLELREPEGAVLRRLWPFRELLWSRVVFGGDTYRKAGRPWFEWHQLTKERLRSPFTITFAFVATHNHFVLDRGGSIFGRSAPIIKLPDAATEDDHLALLAYLNSSTACFWMKQVFFDKGNQGGEKGRPTEPFEAYFEFDATKVRALPLPPNFEKAKGSLADFSRRLVELANLRLELVQLAPIVRRAASAEEIGAGMEEARLGVIHTQNQMREAQEQLDWFVYRLFGITDHIPHPFEARPPGARVSDRVWAVEAFRNGSSIRYFDLCHAGDAEEVASEAWATRWSLRHDEQELERKPELSLMETPAYKRTYKDSFGTLEFVGQAQNLVLGWLESELSRTPEVSQLRDWLSTARLESEAVFAWLESSGYSSVPELVETDSAPFVAACRYTETGIAKFAVWIEVWALQRLEDQGLSVEISSAPKYGHSDFMSNELYRLRGPLDVPKERFISYPYCESDEDGEPVYGWAGWDHLQRAQALGALYLKRREEGWGEERVTPMLAGLLELIPWVKQWHNEPSAEFGGLKMGDYYAQFLDEECRRHGLTHDDLRAWRPPKKTKKAAAPKAKKAKEANGERAAAEAADGVQPKAKRTRKKKTADAETAPAEETE